MIEEAPTEKAKREVPSTILEAEELGSADDDPPPLSGSMHSIEEAKVTNNWITQFVKQNQD